MDLPDCPYRVALRTADGHWVLQEVPSSPAPRQRWPRSRSGSGPTLPSQNPTAGRDAVAAQSNRCPPGRASSRWSCFPTRGLVDAEVDGDDHLDPRPNERVTTRIDCFHTEADLPASRLRFTLGRAEPPSRHLLAVTVRPLEMRPQTPKATRTATPPPPALSQMQAPKTIQQRICSPTALAMTLKAVDAGIDWLEVVEGCFDQRTQSYGCWPMAIRCAAGFGRLGAVEALPGWEPAIQVLRAGLPIVASIDFAAGELPGAPLSQTAGHLVTCYGVDGDAVLVNDPAAGDAGGVPRRYDLEAFSQAWLCRRGAAYIVPAP